MDKKLNEIGANNNLINSLNLEFLDIKKEVKNSILHNKIKFSKVYLKKLPKLGIKKC